MVLYNEADVDQITRRQREDAWTTGHPGCG